MKTRQSIEKSIEKSIFYRPYQHKKSLYQLAKELSPFGKIKNKRSTNEYNSYQIMIENSTTSTNNSIINTSRLISKNSSIQKVPQFIKTKKSKNKSYLKFQTTQKDLKLAFSIGHIIGKGSNGSVRIVRHKQTGFFLALKQISKKQITFHQRFITQLKIHLLCDHPNINKLYSVFHDNNYVYLLLELCIDGDLMKKMQNDNYDYDRAKQYVKGTARGLRYLHMNRIMHRDLKLENIILCFDMPKITDFDLATIYYCNSKVNRSVCGSPAYMSPEMLLESYYNEKIDIWSFGIVCFEILCKYYPFDVDNFAQLYKTVIEGKMRQYPSTLKQQGKLLLDALLKKNPYDRPGWKQILEQPFFQ